MYGHSGSGAWGRRTLLGGLLPLLVVGSLVLAAPAGAEERAPRVQTATVRLESMATGYQRGGSLGLALRDTVTDEVLYRRARGNEQGLLWSARFVSRWALTDDQLDRWSAQVIGLWPTRSAGTCAWAAGSASPRTTSASAAWPTATRSSRRTGRQWARRRWWSSAAAMRSG